MSRPRSESPIEDSPTKRVPSISSDASHYDIYLIPSTLPLFPSSNTSSSLNPNSIKSASFLIVNQSASLSGLGISFTLTYSPIPSSSNSNQFQFQFIPVKNQGFYLPREASFNTLSNQSIQLGWIGEDLLIQFEKVLNSTTHSLNQCLHSNPSSNLDYNPSTQLMMLRMIENGKRGGGELIREWLIDCLRELEKEGIVCNGELLARVMLNELLVL